MTRANVLTIGHSTHSIEKLLELLLEHDVTAVADVRSAPYSRFQPQFAPFCEPDCLHYTGDLPACR